MGETTKVFLLVMFFFSISGLLFIVIRTIVDIINIIKKRFKYKKEEKEYIKKHPEYYPEKQKKK